MNWNQQIVEAARRYEGLKEWPGAKSNPDVEALFAAAGFPGMTDDVPWCAAFVGAVLAEVGVLPSGSLMARSYLTWGMNVPLQEARPGDVVVFPRGAAPAGHVAFFLRFDKERVIVLEGNANNSVREGSHPTATILRVRRADPSTKQDETTVKRGDSNASVINLQMRLRQLGRFTGKIDGVFGTYTDQQVRGFQADYKLESDGVVGPRTWEALKAATGATEAAVRPDRVVDAKDLKAAGSKTIISADKATVGVAGAGAILSMDAVTDAVEKAQGVIPTVSVLLRDHWPVLLALGVLVGVWYLHTRIKAARVRAAVKGENLSK